MRISVINPNTTMEMTQAIGVAARRSAAPGTELLVSQSASGPSAIEGPFDGAMCLPGALERPDSHPRGQRDRHIAAINANGRMKWQIATGYGNQSLVETAIGRYKSIIGRRLRARSLAAQRTEVAIGCSVLNRMLGCARPKSVRCENATVQRAPSKTEIHHFSDPCNNASNPLKSKL